MSKRFIVSNRLPISLEKKKHEIKVTPSVGGLATGMRSFYKEYDSLWIGWPGITDNRLNAKSKADIELKLEKEKCKPVFLSNNDISKYYEGFSNETIWPLFHYFTEYTNYDESEWEAYKRVNQKFFDVIKTELKEDDIIWIHDYHLFLLPELIRKEFEHISIGFFLHIPFPSYEVFRLLPWRDEIVKGILGADLIGFHTFDYQRHFNSSVRRLLGYEVVFNEIQFDNRQVKVDVFPMGIDYEKFRKAAYDSSQLSQKKSSFISKQIKGFYQRDKKNKIILSIDRLDYSKGIAHRLKAYENFLEKYKSYHGKVILIMVAVPSRTNVDNYIQLKKEIDELVGRINGRFGNFEWMPIWYMFRSLDFKQLIDLYKSSNVALVTPLRDGMNLIAKEFIACRTDQTGVLILSEMAGAAKEMGESLIVNPNNENELSDTIYEALNMSEADQKKRVSTMQHRLQRYNVDKWAHDFMDELMSFKKKREAIVSRRIGNELLTSIKQQYEKANKRIFFLDYDGTLVHFKKRPEDAKPDSTLINLLKQIKNDSKNELVIISGRDKDTLTEWLGNLKIKIIAEHGVWIKEPSEGWEMLETMHDEWKEHVRPILEVFVDRTPGSFLEEKNYSLVFHYRKAEAEFGKLRARELKDQLLSLTINMELEIMEGNKVLEVKNAGINKGKAAQKVLLNQNYDFIFGIGDDWTDEYLFDALPEEAITVKVGLQQTKAKYNVANPGRVRFILNEIIK
jgi:trehalose 6-phosphate synthase/phosphatase